MRRVRVWFGEVGICAGSDPDLFMIKGGKQSFIDDL
jgi:hypothetical protein